MVNGWQTAVLREVLSPGVNLGNSLAQLWGVVSFAKTARRMSISSEQGSCCVLLLVGPPNLTGASRLCVTALSRLDLLLNLPH